jgi:hypothetical protein
MRFMAIVKSKEQSGPPPRELMDEIMKLGAQGFQNGTLVQTGGLLPTAMGARVRLAGGKVSVIDGPFTEAKEVFGGFAVYDLPSREEAIEATKAFMELHRKFWPGWEGETEIRQMMDQPPMPGAGR